MMPTNEWFEFLAARGIGPEVIDAIELICAEGMDSALNGPGSRGVRADIAHFADRVMREFIADLRDTLDNDEPEGDDEPE